MKHYFFTTTFILAILKVLPSFSQLAAGDLMFVGFNADQYDGFAIIALNDIPANSTIYFSDNEWNGQPIGAGGAFNDLNEGELTWHTGGNIITAGTVITFDEITSTSNPSYGATIGTLTGVTQIANSNEVIYAFTGSNNTTPTTFLSAIANSGFSGNGTLSGTGLTSGLDAIEFTADQDIMVYNGSLICSNTIVECQQQIANTANWLTDDGGGNQTNDASGSDWPVDIPSDFGGTLLPIELIEFTATREDGKVILHWKTASELNNDYFKISRSTDGKTFISLGTVSGKGSTKTLSEYSFSDHNPAGSVIYYRLSQHDFDGQSESFPVVRVGKNFSLSPITLSPIPACDYVQINGDDVASISLMTLEGMVLKTIKGGSTRMDLTGHDTGLYLIKVTLLDGSERIEKLLKK